MGVGVGVRGCMGVGERCMGVGEGVYGCGCVSVCACLLGGSCEYEGVLTQHAVHLCRSTVTLCT